MLITPDTGLLWLEISGPGNASQFLLAMFDIDNKPIFKEKG